MKNNKVISPISLDVGAKFTGVYYAKYPKKTNMDQIEKQGEVLIYNKKDDENKKHDEKHYTILLKNRTAKRHQRRGQDRLRFAKRLFVVILEKYFHFSTHEHQQAIGFFLNRRGFTYLDQDFSRKHLNDIPDQSWEIFKEQIKNIPEVGEKLTKENLANKIDELTNSEPERIEAIWKQLEEKIDYYKSLNNLKELTKPGMDLPPSPSKKKNNNNEISRWILKEVTEKYNIPFFKDVLEKDKNNSIDIKQYLSQESEQNRKSIADLLSIEENNLKELKWNFKPYSFDIDKNQEKLDENDVNTHLHHLCFAFCKINEEMKSGARHRSKFFEEIKYDLKNLQDHSHLYLKKFGTSITEHNNLDIDKLYHLICHVSNFELKPLRAYFNSKAHKDGDQWDLEQLTRITSKWFLKYWRVTESKDGKNKLDKYHELRQAWKEHIDKDDIIKFWLATEPVLTIPPYQSMTNRRPPKCQSLVLDADYMDKHYSNWEKWLSLLEKNVNYENTLLALISGKSTKEKVKRLLDEKQIKLRRFQLLLDVSKKADEKINNYKLNDLWSIYHKIQQNERDNITDKNKELKKRLKECMANSQLPQELKKSLDFTMEGGVGHFLNKYYTRRKRARNGRYFLHQEKKGKWIGSENILCMCPHKPRQKQYQMGLDLANIFQISSENFAKIIKKEEYLNPELQGSKAKGQERARQENMEEDHVISWLKGKDFQGLKGIGEDSAKLQKEHRGNLKNKLDWAVKLDLSIQSKKLTSEQQKENKDLVKHQNKCEDMANKLAEKLWPKLTIEQKKEKADKFKSPFSFAQIYNITYKDRSGFSKTCPVCSADNNERMRILEDSVTVQASRLPALNIRLIDGAVMRYCSIIARHISHKVWTWHIEENLNNNNHVSVPLILEQNHFEFEPALKELKKLDEKKEKNKQDQDYDYQQKKYEIKKDRIKQDANGICAYSGKYLSDDTEIDHIIPRVSRYGTLNDEANLICVKTEANKNKCNEEYSLYNLNSEYKKKIFKGKNDSEITKWIEEILIGPIKDEHNPEAISMGERSFIFGRYLSFINLNEDQRVAFRHALFLSPGNKIRQKVIDAITNVNRTLVNGTQRYLAQCIADELWHKAKKIEKQKYLSFDYFEYSSRQDVANSIYNLRQHYENLHPELLDYTKKKGTSQKEYSHLLDAQMAFLLAINDHQNEGSMGIIFPEDQDIKQAKMFEYSCIPFENLHPHKLAGQTNNNRINSETLNKKVNLAKLFSRYLFTENAMGERYKPIIEFDDRLYIGYPQKQKDGMYDLEKYCQKITKPEDIKIIKEIIKNKKYYELVTENKQIKIYAIRKVNKHYKQFNKDSHKYFSQYHSTYTPEQKEEIEQIEYILENCRYYVKKTELIKAPNVLKNTQTYPFYQEWVAFDKAWKKEAGEEYKVIKGKLLYEIGPDQQEKWETFCKKRLKISNKTSNKHTKIRKKFSMLGTGIPSGSPLRINRHGNDIYQVVPLNNKIIAKNRSNFLVKNSQNLAVASKDADKQLSTPITTEVELHFENKEIDSKHFLKDEFSQSLNSDELINIKIFLYDTKIRIENFPIKKFKECIHQFKETNKTIKFVAEKSISSQEPDETYAYKSKIDECFQITPRSDISIKEIQILNDTVSFVLPYKKEDIVKWYEKQDN